MNTPKRPPTQADEPSNLLPTEDQNAGHPRPHSRAFYDDARRHVVRRDDAHAFVRDPSENRAHVGDDLAEELAEEYLTSATTGEAVGQEALDEVLVEEEGGPFITVPPDREFAAGTDLSNPSDAEPEPFPTPNAQSRR